MSRTAVESTGPGSRAIRSAVALLAVILLSCLAVAAPAMVGTGADRMQDHRLDGEYGLYVRLDGDTVRVGWITREHGLGVLEVVAGDRVVHTDTTPPGLAHASTFVHAAADGELLRLRYGALQDAADRHETTADLRTGHGRPPVAVNGVDSLFIIGDVHGEYDTLTAVLRNAGIIGEGLRWAAGRSHLVFAGDLMDRGDDVTRVLWFVEELERQAAAAGGGLHVVLGNHEIMVMTGDARYISPKESHLARLHGVEYARLFDPRHTLLGRWLTSRPGMIRVDDVLIAHGGVSTDWLSTTLTAFDDTLAVYTGDAAFQLWADTLVPLPLDSVSFQRRNAFFWEPNSVFWYRDYARSDTLGSALRAVLNHFEARLHVVGHTPGPDVRSAYDGDLVLTNTAPFGRELLLLVRESDGWARFRIATSGPPIPL